MKSKKTELIKKIGKFVFCEFVGIILASAYAYLFGKLYKLNSFQAFVDANLWDLVLLAIITIPIITCEIISSIRQTPRIYTRFGNNELSVKITVEIFHIASLILVTGAFFRLTCINEQYVLIGFFNVMFVIFGMRLITNNHKQHSKSI